MTDAIEQTGAKRHYVSWTTGDERLLIAHSKAKTPVRIVAEMMGRTERAVIRRAGMLGVGLGNHRNHR